MPNLNVRINEESHKYLKEKSNLTLVPLATQVRLMIKKAMEEENEVHKSRHHLDA